jgi:tRNA(Ile)-lysidine synthase
MVSYLLIKKAQKTIRQYAMFQEKERVLVAVSGGPDSLTLLNVLHRLAPSLDLTLIVAHVNHRLRGEESAKDAAFVQSCAVELGWEFCLAEVDVLARAAETKESIQEAARELRYEAFINLGKRYHAAKIALGHTADDQAETMLMHLIRGSGPEGMGGIPPVRDGIFVRPLIEVPRAMIETFINRERIPCRYDSSNKKRKYLRNRIRLDLLPILKQNYNPNLCLGLSEISDIFRAESAFMEKIIDRIWPDILQEEGTDAIHLNLEAFRGQDIAIQRRIIRRAYEMLKGNKKGLSLKQIRSALSLSGDREKVINLSDGLRIRKTGNTLSLGKFTPHNIPEIEISVPGAVSAGCYRVRTELLIIPPSSFPPHNREVFFDWDKLVPPLVLRSCRPGDVMTLLGMKGHKKIQDIFTDARIPRYQRQSIPILCDRKGVLWVAGIRRCNRATVDSQSRSILHVEINDEKT